MIRFHGLTVRARAVGGGFIPPQLYESFPRSPPIRLQDLGRSPQLTFLLHGFAVNEREGRISLRNFAELVRNQLPNLDGDVVALLWPGDDLLSPITYSLEERAADKTARMLADLIALTLRPATSVNFVAHSLGCRVVLEAMRWLRVRGLTSDQVVLMAGAVDADALARSTRYRDAVSTAKRVSVLSSQRDNVLKFAFPVGDFLAGVLFGGYTTRALGLVGPRNADTEVVPRPVRSTKIPDRDNVGHHDYLPGEHVADKQRAAAGYVAQSIRGDADPAYLLRAGPPAPAVP
jgi:esterase/lipase superfamily enzyme